MKLNLKSGKYYKEIWKDIVVDKEDPNTYKGLYQVSNMGRIKSLSRILSNNHIIEGKILKNKIGKSGYNSVNLSKNGKAKTYKVHRLVALTFIPNPENKPYIDHINTIRIDNRVSNLRWVTQKENNNNELSLIHYSEGSIGKNKGKKRSEEHKKKLSERTKGENNPAYGTHTNGKRVICLDNNIIYDSCREAGRQLNCDNSAISSVCKGKREHTNNLHFMYYEEYLKNNK